MSLEQLAISIPVVAAFAIFALQLVKLNNKQTTAFINQLAKLQETFLIQLEGQAKIFDGRNNALISSLEALNTTNQVNEKAMVQALQCLASQVEFSTAILIKHDVRMYSHAIHLSEHLKIPPPTEALNPYRSVSKSTKKSNGQSTQ